jgi:hypothetical protein
MSPKMNYRSIKLSFGKSITALVFFWGVPAGRSGRAFRLYAYPWAHTRASALGAGPVSATIPNAIKTAVISANRVVLRKA